MSVYFIRVGRYFKIGYSADAARRFERLHLSGTRYTFPGDCSTALADRDLYRVVDGDKGREDAIQLALDNFSVGLEWFLDESPLRDFVDALPVEYDRHNREAFTAVERVGGWCEADYRAVQHGRAERETERYMAGRSA